MEIFQNEVFLNDTLDDFILVEGEETFGLVKVLFPNALRILTAVNAIEKETVRLQYATDLLQHGRDLRLRNVKQAVECIDGIEPVGFEGQLAKIHLVHV